jgi:hypothetical protein
MKALSLSIFNRNGEMIFLTTTEKTKEEEESEAKAAEAAKNVVQEDPIDQYLTTQDGWVPRARDERL